MSGKNEPVISRSLELLMYSLKKELIGKTKSVMQVALKKVCLGKRFDKTQ